ncbi:2-deoxy-scyllo-inosose synthase [Streptomyces sp. RY43-2]|uniref:2-deoxy-scyllo-inosose synthase n=1 Tax=Streptomyces macrolidinus TaxID=2952607 RepID=A0ABT0ZM13_9ACTN|nr:2-deoxy-scyllo-inosose synthase [Streptomyces macrolidinus]MCN9244629.1 2-deoxy-scyllo-inosose synthase [Streptomyces macrolidinus]
MARVPLIELTTGLRPASPYHLGDGITELLPDHLARHDFDDLFLVCGEGIRDLLAEPLARRLSDAHLPVTVLTVPESEGNKSWTRLTELCERLVHAGATKQSIILALGGGMVSNLTGLAAGLLYRGVRYVDIPTTLLSLTDGTLSNKQAINGRGGKNQFGLYHAPLFVWADVAHLRTERPVNHKSGLVEAVKNGLIDDSAWFDRLAAQLTPDLAAVHDDLLGVCRQIVESKLRILATDPSERERAVILEYGHTVGHATEFLCGDLPHGVAVGIGMCLAARVGIRLGITPPEVLEKQEWVLGERLGLPTRIPPNCTPDQILNVIRTDNKRRSSEETHLILLDAIGRVHDSDGTFETPVPESVLKIVLQES